MHCGQRFKFDVMYALEILKLIENGYGKKNDLQKALAIGKNKIDTYVEWLIFIDSIHIEKSNIKLSAFGKKLLQLKNNDEFIYPLIYSKLCRGWNNGGHFYFSRLINDIIYDVAFSSNNIISIEEIKERMLTFKSEIQVKEDDIKTLTRLAISSLADEENGFGKMGIIKEVENNNIYVSYYDPHYLVAAYIIFDRWDEGDTAFKFDDIVNGDYNLGKIFFMFKEDIYPIFEKMKQNNLISIEITGGLNQIAKNPGVTKEEILEEMVKYV